MDRQEPPLERRLGSRVVTIASACALGIAALGFTFGIETPQPPPLLISTVSATEGTRIPAPDAPFYAAIAEAPLGPNRGFTSALATLQSPAPATAPKVLDSAKRILAIDERKGRRAYDGAPPVIPHPVDSRKVDSCLACHRDGIVVGDRLAPRIPHEAFTSCTQCHVESASSRFEEPITVASDFQGFFAAPIGHRAALGAPPVIPHGTLMRVDCLACHGLLGREGLRTTHPERQNCVQCHGVASMLDFKTMSAGPTFFSEHDDAKSKP